MAQVPGIGSASAGTAPAAGPARNSVENIEERFLRLLVTQMRNQDPLNPLDNAQVTTQLAQLNTVSGINQLNETMKALAASFASTQSLEAAGMIGRSVMVAGNRVDLVGGQALFGAELAQPVDSLIVSIHDTAGNLVHRVDAGPQNAGIVALHWDGATDAGGKAPSGRYVITVKALIAGQATPAQALNVRQVESVSTGAGGARLNLEGGGSAALTEVKQII